MDRHHIEKKDLEVIEKYRSAVVDKHLAKQIRIRMAKRFGLLLAICCIVLLVFFGRPGRERPVSTAAKAVKIAAVNNTGSVGSLATAPDQRSIGQTATPEAREQKSPVESDLAGNRTESATSTIHKSTEKSEQGEIPPEDRKMIRPEFSKPASALFGTRITKITTCSFVVDRQHSTPQKVFSVQKDAKAFVWINIHSKKVPYTIRLAFYHNGRRYCSIPLRIRYLRTRTWGYITLNKKNAIGKWHADVLLKEQRLSRIPFTVVP